MKVPTFALLISFMLSFAAFLLAEQHPIWNPTGTESEILSRYHGVSQRVSNYCAMGEVKLRSQINTNGATNALNIDMVKITYDLALLYHVTGTSNYAYLSALLLDQYADVFTNWPVKDNNPGYYGYWGQWFHYDLMVAHLLPVAHDLICNSGAYGAIDPGTSNKVIAFFTLALQRDLAHNIYIENPDGAHPAAFIIFGRAMDDPKLVHLGVWYYNKMIHEYYCQDGFMQEGSRAYSKSTTSSLVDWFAREDREPYHEALYGSYLHGYSDPDGYSHTPYEARWDTARIDSYDVTQHYGQWARMSNVLMITFPDAVSFPIMNDDNTNSFDTLKLKNAAAVVPTESFLWTGIGHAALVYGSGTNQTQVHLDYSPGVGHQHYDANHLIIYSKQREVIGGTGYNDGNRTWNTSTKNQNLVVVNDFEQKHHYYVNILKPPYIPGSTNITPVTNKTFYDSTVVHNNTMLWEPGYRDFKEVQFIETDARSVYTNVYIETAPHGYTNVADRYTRVLALVHIDSNDVYVADFVRVKGGWQYDWTTHGGHSLYDMTISLPMRAATGSLGYINFSNMVSTGAVCSAVLDYGPTKHKVTIVGKNGSTFYTGGAPRSITDGGCQWYFVVRRTNSISAAEDFLAVQESYTASPRVTGVSGLTFDGDSGTAIGMAVTLDNGVVDYILHTMDNGPTYAQHVAQAQSEIRLNGRAAHIRTRNGDVEWMYLVNGSSLSYGPKTLTAKNGDFGYRGYVTNVNRLEDGATENSFEVDTALPSSGWLTNKTFIVTWGNGWKWAYKIKSVVGTRVITDDEPGFRYSGDGIDMQYFPIQEYFGLKEYPGPITFIIAGSALMNNMGEIISTEGDYRVKVAPTPPTYLRTIEGK